MKTRPLEIVFLTAALAVSPSAQGLSTGHLEKNP